MRRSEINAIMGDALAFLSEFKFALPPFAYWTPEEWRIRGEEAREIVERRLGWDITDFGQGDYGRVGLFIFTLRNGMPENLATGRGKVYAEKILICGVDQRTPLHFHWAKTEDIINRGGGDLAIRLYNAAEDESLAASELVVSTDGVIRRIPAGETLVLRTGESITVPAQCYHTFWGVRERVLVGEVSTVNDDAHDNHFHDPVGRFPAIDEDEDPLHLLVTDYERYYSCRGGTHGMKSL